MTNELQNKYKELIRLLEDSITNAEYLELLTQAEIYKKIVELRSRIAELEAEEFVIKKNNQK